MSDSDSSSSDSSSGGTAPLAAAPAAATAAAPPTKDSAALGSSDEDDSSGDEAGGEAETPTPVATPVASNAAPSDSDSSESSDESDDGGGAAKPMRAGGGQGGGKGKGKGKGKGEGGTATAATKGPASDDDDSDGSDDSGDNSEREGGGGASSGSESPTAAAAAPLRKPKKRKKSSSSDGGGGEGKNDKGDKRARKYFDDMAEDDDDDGEEDEEEEEGDNDGNYEKDGFVVSDDEGLGDSDEGGAGGRRGKKKKKLTRLKKAKMPRELDEEDLDLIRESTGVHLGEDRGRGTGEEGEGRGRGVSARNQEELRKGLFDEEAGEEGDGDGARGRGGREDEGRQQRRGQDIDIDGGYRSEESDFIDDDIGYLDDTAPTRERVGGSRGAGGRGGGRRRGPLGIGGPGGGRGRGGQGGMGGEGDYLQGEEGPSQAQWDEMHDIFGDGIMEVIGGGGGEGGEDGGPGLGLDGEDGEGGGGGGAGSGWGAGVDEAGVRLKKASSKEMEERRRIAMSKLEPALLREYFITEHDGVIKATDRPERLQTRNIGRGRHSSGVTDTERRDEADWIFQQLTFDREVERPSQVKAAIERVLSYFTEEEYEVPFVWQHRKDYFQEAGLDRGHLWRIFDLDEKWEKVEGRRLMLEAGCKELWSMLRGEDGEGEGEGGEGEGGQQEEELDGDDEEGAGDPRYSSEGEEERKERRRLELHDAGKRNERLRRAETALERAQTGLEEARGLLERGAAAANAEAMAAYERESAAYATKLEAYEDKKASLESQLAAIRARIGDGDVLESDDEEDEKEIEKERNALGGEAPVEPQRPEELTDEALQEAVRAGEDKVRQGEVYLNGVTTEVEMEVEELETVRRNRLRRRRERKQARREEREAALQRKRETLTDEAELLPESHYGHLLMEHSEDALKDLQGYLNLVMVRQEEEKDKEERARREGGGGAGGVGDALLAIEDGGDGGQEGGGGGGGSSNGNGNGTGRRGGAANGTGSASGQRARARRSRRKRPSRARNERYRACRREGLRSLAKRFTIGPAAFGASLQSAVEEGGERIPTPGEDPLAVAAEYVAQSPGHVTLPKDPKGADPMQIDGDDDTTNTPPSLAREEAMLSAVRHMVACEVAAEPTVRRRCRALFRRYATVSSMPTDKGLREIDYFHPLYGLQYLRGKPVLDFLLRADLSDGTMLLKLDKAQREDLLTYTLHPPMRLVPSPHTALGLAMGLGGGVDGVDGAGGGYGGQEGGQEEQYELDIGVFMRELEPTFNPQGVSCEGVSPHVKAAWDLQRDKILHEALEDMLLPSLQAELLEEMRLKAREEVVSQASAALQRRLEVGPYADLHMSRFLQLTHPTNGEFPVVAIAVAQGPRDTSYCVALDPDGMVKDHMALPGNRDQLRRKLKDFLIQAKPLVVLINTSAGQHSRSMGRLLHQTRRAPPDEYGGQPGPPIESGLLIDALREYEERRSRRETKRSGGGGRRGGKGGGGYNSDDSDEDENDSLGFNEEEEEEEEWVCRSLFMRDDVSMVFAHSKRAEQELPDYHVNLRLAISLGRMAQEPLAEYCGLWTHMDSTNTFGGEMLYLSLHELQAEVSKSSLLRVYEQRLVDAVNDRGVDLASAVEFTHLKGLLQFVGGLGPKKAAALRHGVQQVAGGITERQQLLTHKLLGTSVFDNAASFLRIGGRGSRLEDRDLSLNPFDSMRIHPECYVKHEWAPKMCANALEVENDLDEYVGVVKSIMDEAESALKVMLKATGAAAIDWHPDSGPELEDKLYDLDLSLYAQELERQGQGKRQLQLETIKQEIRFPFLDRRRPYSGPSEVELFEWITGESRNTLRSGMKVTVRVNEVNRGGVKGVLEGCGGIWAFVKAEDALDVNQQEHQHYQERVDPEELKVLFPRGKVVEGVILEVREARFETLVSLKQSDLVPEPQRWGERWQRPAGMPPLDHCFDDQSARQMYREALTKRMADMEKATAEARMADGTGVRSTKGLVPRNVKHPNFENLQYSDAEALLLKQRVDPDAFGAALVRPSSKGADRLSLTWLWMKDSFVHIDIQELDKPSNPHLLGGRLQMKGEEYEDLDELLSRFVSPCNDLVKEVLASPKYHSAAQEGVHKQLLADKAKSPQAIPYYIHASKRSGCLFISYVPGSQTVKRETVQLTGDGFLYRDKVLPSLRLLLADFKKTCSQRSHSSHAGSTSSRAHSRSSSSRQGKQGSRHLQSRQPPPPPQQQQLYQQQQYQAPLPPGLPPHHQPQQQQQQQQQQPQQQGYYGAYPQQQQQQQQQPPLPPSDNTRGRMAPPLPPGFQPPLPPSGPGYGAPGGYPGQAQQQQQQQQQQQSYGQQQQQQQYPPLPPTAPGQPQQPYYNGSSRQ